MDAILPEIIDSLNQHPNLVIEAPPGAGKTTRVPPALLEIVSGEVVVLEPRRIAARLAARRVAWEFGEPLGETVGYQVRFEEAIGPHTRLRFVTEGVDVTGEFCTSGQERDTVTRGAGKWGGGTQNISANFTPTDTTNYMPASATNSITVNPAAPTVTFTGAPANAIKGATFLISATTNASTTPTITASSACTVAVSLVTMTSSAGTCSLTAKWAADSNYLAASATQSTSATTSTVTINWTPPSAITYGTPLSGTQLNATATYNGATVPGTFVYTPAAGVGLTAGTQRLSVIFTPADTSSYTQANASTTITVNKATPTINWTPPAAISYGSALSAAQLNATASVGGTSVPGTFVYSPAAGAVLAGGTQTLSVTFTPTDVTDYTTAQASVTLQINSSPLTITWGIPTAINYGTALSVIQLNAKVTNSNNVAVAGTYVYTPPAGTVLTAGGQTLSVTFTPTSNVDYSPITTTVSLTVNQVTPKVTWAKPAAIAYGTALDNVNQLNATASVPGTFVYSPAAGTVLLAGVSQPLSATFTPTDTTNYATALASTTITVNTARPTITWGTPGSISYGTQLSSAQLNASATDVNGNPLAGTFVYSPAAGVVLGGGLHTLSATFTPTDTTDYSTGRATVTLQVNPVTPTISWTPTGITYGTALSVIQLNAKATYNNGMAAAGTYLYDPPAGTVLTAGTQTLSVTFTPTSATDFTGSVSTSVTLQVTPATPKITWAKPAAITYGTALSSTQLNATATDLHGNPILGTFSYTPLAGTVLPGGTQTLSVSFMPNDTTDYLAPKTATTTFTVIKAPSSTSVSSSTPNPSVVNMPVTASFSVTANGPTGQTLAVNPTGTVTVKASTGESCSGTVAAGSCSLTFKTTGTRTLTASYAGDSNFTAGSSSGTVTQVVNPVNP